MSNLLSTRHLRELIIASLAFAVCAAVSAQAALRAIEASIPPAPTLALAAGYEAEDHFPGAALFYVADADAAPSAGTTGTAALPDLPVPADWAPGGADGTVIPARAFSLAAAAAIDHARALQCLADAVYYEAASESDDGQRAVAQVVLNRVRHPAFPNTVCGVVYQGSERATGCQFSFACDGALARGRAPAAWRKALAIAGAALGGYVFAPVGLATHYHTYAVTPAWNRQLVMTDAIGAHFFHRWAGYWGTPAAFSIAYAGGEPLPGPHARPVDPVALAAKPSTAAIAPAPALTATEPARATTALAMIQPAYADSGAPRVDPAADMLPQSQILDRWRDSGTPLR